MSEIGPTPGPWLHYAGQIIAEGRVIATVALSPTERGGGTDRERSNAHLLAAAPDLYAALQRVTNELEEWRDWAISNNKITHSAREDLNRKLKAARDATIFANIGTRLP
jgi:hypothetical protein